MGTCWIPVPTLLLIALWIGLHSRGSSTCWSSSSAVQRAPASPSQQTGEIAERCPKLPSSPPQHCRLTPSSTLGLTLLVKGSSQVAWAPTEGQPWYQLVPSCVHVMEWLTPVTASPLQHIIPWLSHCPGTPASPGATCVSSILEASFSSCVPEGKPSLLSVWWGIHEPDPGSRYAARVYVTTPCTWPMTPTAACLEQQNITGNELCSWAETLTMNYSLLSFLRLLSSHFLHISRWWE